MAETRRALIVIDVQNDYFAEEGPLAIQYPDRFESLANITRAIDLAHKQGMPIVSVQHEYPAGAPVFAQGSEGWKLHPEIASRRTDSWKHLVKSYSSVFAGTDFEAWLRENKIETITIVGYMTNNCDLATAVEAEPRGIAVELLSDASGAIHLANEAGTASAQQVHETLMVLLQSSMAAVASTDDWAQAVAAGTALPKSDLGTSAVQGRAAFAPVA
ncbi:MAG: isochorismatase family protein [Paeniglutamicibacter terrestris]|uniref:Isochorismatase family protein n=1 Tax=Paeniglutamicibacter terrestris TaxID=2723403 RepID=A0ABX1G5C9_9MICC|nr:isochorismatase family protein [Paeniglutamicibacter terrestris]ASN40729.1 isochorismatase [Arthrobacter sp. 7749]NKG21229.1 isochorismatase family protein [Paeniglutamicibacter terrestris]